LVDGSVEFPVAVNAWSVAGSTLASPDIASNLFALSLFPYLGFLYFLSRPETKTPKLANFGFQFLLVFVFATIPAGIYAKVAYNDILANVDYLHGLAESFLTITNLIIILGFRNTRECEKPIRGFFPFESSAPFWQNWEEPTALFALAALCLLTAWAGFAGFHPLPEPDNALSIPTWIVHSSSLIE
jgi:hypothetical protein